MTDEGDMLNVNDEPSKGRDVNTQDFGDDDEDDFTPEEVQELVDKEEGQD